MLNVFCKHCNESLVWFINENIMNVVTEPEVLLRRTAAQAPLSGRRRCLLLSVTPSPSFYLFKSVLFPLQVHDCPISIRKRSPAVNVLYK